MYYGANLVPLFLSSHGNDSPLGSQLPISTNKLAWAEKSFDTVEKGHLGRKFKYNVNSN